MWWLVCCCCSSWVYRWWVVCLRVVVLVCSGLKVSVRLFMLGISFCMLVVLVRLLVSC